MMFLPQVILAILASGLSPVSGPSLDAEGCVLLAGLSADLLAMTLLALSPLLQDSPRQGKSLLCAVSRRQVTIALTAVVAWELSLCSLRGLHTQQETRQQALRQ